MSLPSGNGFTEGIRGEHYVACVAVADAEANFFASIRANRSASNHDLGTKHGSAIVLTLFVPTAVEISVQRLHSYVFVPMVLVLDGHCVRADSLLASNAFQSSEDATIIVFVALHRKSAFSLASGPRQADVVFL
jgi:hypothetical protein